MMVISCIVLEIKRDIGGKSRSVFSYPLLREIVTNMFALISQIFGLSGGVNTLWGKKLHPFIFCNNFVQLHYILIIFGTQILK